MTEQDKTIEHDAQDIEENKTIAGLAYLIFFFHL